MRPTHIGVYAEVDANLVDGSSIWLQSVCLMLARIDGTRLTVILRTAPTRDLVVAPLRGVANIRVVDGAGVRGVRRLDPHDAAQVAADLDAEQPFEAFVVRGAGAADALASGPLAGRLWLYHVPAAPEHPGDRDRLRARVGAAARVLCQTPAIVRRVTAAVPSAGPRCVLLAPMVAPAHPRTEALDPERPRLVYAGKFSPEYCVLQTLDAFAMLRAERPGAVLRMAGDKVHDPPEDPSFQPRVRAALAQTPGLAWLGAIPRAAVGELLADSDIGLSIRTPALDGSDEISTKVLEYGIAGCAVLLNRNETHADLLGDDYPLFVSDPAAAGTVLVGALRDGDALAEAARRCRAASEPYTFDAVARRIAPLVREAAGGAGAPAPRPARSPQSLLFAGHQLKFAAPLQRLARSLGHTVHTDLWRRHNEHDEALSRAALAQADIVVCEWCLGSAVWYAREQRRDQRVVVRFHRFELISDLPARLDPRQVEAVVFVADWVRAAAIKTFRWQAGGRFEVIENSVDIDALSLPKLPGAEFNLAFVGFVPQLKRLDLALDVLEVVRARDPRFRLILKGHEPWNHAWMLKRDGEREFYERCYRRIRESPLLGAAVTFEPHASDLPEFLRKAGWILSLSDVEGHAVALSEGMASGAVPVIVERPGAREQYPADWVHADADGAAAHILEVTCGGRFAAGSAASRSYAERWSPDAILPRWESLLFAS